MSCLNYEKLDKRVAACRNTYRITEYLSNSLGDNYAFDIQEKEEHSDGRLDYDQEPDNLGHEVSKNLLSSYMRELGRIRLLTKEEEKALAKEIQEGQRDLVHRLLKLGLEIDEIDILIRKRRNISDELMAAIVGKLERLEKEDKISPHKMTLLSEIRNFYARLCQLKGEMLKRNLRLVGKIAREYLHSGISLSDLVQEGNLGLMRAVTKFDYKRGCRFSTYATWWIRQAMLRAIVEKESIIRIPAHLMERRKKLTKTYSQLLQKWGTTPRPEEIAKTAGIPLTVVQKALFSLPKAISWETPVGEESNLGYFMEDDKSLSPYEVMEREEVTQMVEKGLSHLPPREAEVLRLRFGIGRDGEHTLEEIGGKFGISRERVRQLEKKGINRLKHWRKELSG